MESLLAELEALLYGYNYAVFLRVYRVPFVSDQPAGWYVSQALGSSAVVSGLTPISALEILTGVERSLRYAGDEGSGPRPEVLCAPRFQELVSALRFKLERAAAGASLLARFRLREGHPAYPVFWDFAYVIAGPAGGLVFIGSSSD